jgi:predicted glutamine amidotransferase
MEMRNKDGFGYSYINKGEIITYKWALSFTELLKRGYPLLNHMPGDSWTIMHMRAASCGAIAKENSHPFIIDKKWSICHNGSFREHGIVSFALSKFINLNGHTDSEVAANLIALTSPREFALNDEIVQAGIYLCLNKNGTLEVIKSSGDLTLSVNKNKTVIVSSELSYLNYAQQSANRGWYKFNEDGTFAKFVERKWNSSSFKGQTWIGNGGYYKHGASSHLGNVESYSVAQQREFYSGD